MTTFKEYSSNLDKSFKKAKYFEKLTKGLKELQVVKKSVVVSAYELKEDTEVETPEGVMKGKKGSYLMFGVEGEPYICQKEIFEKTYMVANTFIERMKIELNELKERIDKLERYANKDTLMKLQLAKMIEYKLILEERIRKGEKR